MPASCTLASSCSSFDIYSLSSVSSPALPQFMWRFNLIYESGERKEMKADPGEDKHCLIRPPLYLPSLNAPEVREGAGSPAGEYVISTGQEGSGESRWSRSPTPSPRYHTQTTGPACPLSVPCLWNSRLG